MKPAQLHPCVNLGRVAILVFLATTTSSSHGARAGRSNPDEDVFSEDACWIWGPSKAGELHKNKNANTWMLFQKRIDWPYNRLCTNCSFEAKIAADSKYWLWISPENNTNLSFDSTSLAIREGGLKRGPAPQDTWYDPVHIPLDVSRVANSLTIHVLVWYWGKNGYSHNDSGQGGLLLDGSILNDRGETVAALASDSSWRVQRHPAFQAHPKESPPYNQSAPNYRLSEYNIYYDARMETNMDQWQAAIEMGKAGSKPWNQLVPRPIPQWKDYKLLDYKHVQKHQPNNHTLVIQARLHNNTQFYPWIEFLDPNTPSGIRVEIQTDNYRYPTKHDIPTYIRSTYITRQGQQTFESPAWINGHVVTYKIVYPIHSSSIVTTTQPTVRYRPTRYNTRLTGSFESNDEFYNTLWTKARRTLLVNMRDSFMDCPDRERAQWWGDVTVDIHQVFYSLDSRAHALIRKAISDLVHWQKAPKEDDGCPALHAPVPEGSAGRELPVQMLASVGWYGIYGYYRHSGDVQTIQQAYPHVRSYLQNCWSVNATTGLVNHRHGGWDWMDWGDNVDAPLLDNGWFGLALMAAIPMANLSGYKEDIDIWQRQLASIRHNFDAAFWDDNVRAYRSPQHGQGLPDDRGNALAVLAGLVPNDNKGRLDHVAEVLTSQLFASPYMEYFVLEALFQMKQTDVALQRIKTRYQAMVSAKSISTLWEFWELGTGTYNHAWSGGPLSLLSQYVAGVAPASPGWRTFHVLPQLGKDLAHVKVAVPVFLDGTDAVIHVSVDKTELKDGSDCLYKILVSIPKGSVATVGVPQSFQVKERYCGVNTVHINDERAWIRDQENQHFNLTGRGWAPSLKESSDVVPWDVPHGNWRFEGSATCSTGSDTFLARAKVEAELSKDEYGASQTWT